jgi:multiple sugar transport system permease protein
MLPKGACRLLIQERSVQKKRNLTPYLLITPGIALLLIVIYLPFLQNINYSFTDYSLLNKNFSFIGLKNYKDIITGRDFFNSFGKTLVWVSGNMLLILILGLTAAFILNSKTIRGKLFLQIVLLIPWILPEIVTGYIWKFLLTYQSGAYFKILSSLRLISFTKDIFADSAGAMAAVITANTWRSFPILAIMAYAKLSSLSADQLEAAVIDGAGRLIVFFKIELPHIGSTIVTVLTLCFVWTFNAFGIIHVMTGGGPAGATEVLPVFLQRAAFHFYNYSYASAFAVLMIIVLVLTVVFLNAGPRAIVKHAVKEQ